MASDSKKTEVTGSNAKSDKKDAKLPSYVADDLAILVAYEEVIVSGVTTSVINPSCVFDVLSKTLDSKVSLKIRDMAREGHRGFSPTINKIRERVRNYLTGEESVTGTQLCEARDKLTWLTGPPEKGNCLLKKMIEHGLMNWSVQDVEIHQRELDKHGYSVHIGVDKAKHVSFDVPR